MSAHQIPSVLEVENLTVEYYDDGRTVHAVTDLSLSIRRGESIAIIGESGCGKTTAALAMLGMLPAAAKIVSGRVAVTTSNGTMDLLGLGAESLRRMRWQHVAYVPQGSISAFNPIQRIGRHFRQTAHAHGLSRRDAESRAFELLTAVHLDAPRIWNAYPHELSGGTRQRVAIALAMLLKPEVIVLDEPTTALDVLTQEAVLKTLLELQDVTGVSFLAITHDLAVAAAIADEIVTMYAGRAVERGGAEQILKAPQHPYTRGLLESMPTVDSGKPVESIGGTPPSLAALPTGCAFHPRCPVAVDSCHIIEPPALLAVRDGWVACPESGADAALRGGQR